MRTHFPLQIVSYGLPASGRQAPPGGSYGTSQTGGFYPGAYGPSQGGTGYKQSAYPGDVVKRGYVSNQGGFGYGQSAYPFSQNQVFNQGYGQSAFPGAQGGYFGASGGQGVVGGSRGGGFIGPNFGVGGRKASPALSRLLRRVVSYGIPVYAKHRYH